MHETLAAFDVREDILNFSGTDRMVARSSGGQMSL